MGSTGSIAVVVVVVLVAAPGAGCGGAVEAWTSIMDESLDMLPAGAATGGSGADASKLGAAGTVVVVGAAGELICA
ncbi:MAG: hypothetical protein H0V56_01850 [Chthoniobacterales bacterium]|nr:hypothetical protein [Chthoniobacterales bacterium]